MSSKSSARQVHATVTGVPPGRDRQRDAAVVELLGNLVGRSLSVPRSITRRVERGESQQVGRIVIELPREGRRVHRHGRRRRGLLGDDDGPVRELGPQGRQARARRRRIMRLADRLEPADGSICRTQPLDAQRRDLLGRDGLDRALQLGQVTGPADDGLEIAELMGDVRDAVVLEHEPGPQLALGPGDLLRR